MRDLRHLRGWEESPHNWVGCEREGGGEEKWRWDGTSTPEVGLGKKRGSHTQRGPLTERGSAGTERDLWGIGGLEGNAAASQ